MATTFKFGNGNWAVKEDYALAYNDENGNFKPLPFDFTRASSATRVNKQGLIETVPSGKPRIDFLNNTKGHFLLEPSRTNLSTNSEAFDSWTNGGTYVTANQTVSPDGNTTADQLSKTAAFQQIQNTATVVSGSDYSFSVFVKENTLDRITLRLASGSNDVRKCLDLSDLSVVDAGGNQTGFVETKVEEYPNGWYKYTVVATTGGTSLFMNIYAGQANVVESGNIYIWGAQLEAGSHETSYIPTSGSAVTRSAETANGAGNSTVFNDSEGVLFLETSMLSSNPNNSTFQIDDGTSTNRVRIRFTTTTNQINGLLYSGVAGQPNIDYTANDVTNPNKVAIRYQVGQIDLFFNGFEVGTITGNATPTGFNNLSLGTEGNVKQLMVFNEALTDSELEQITSWTSFSEMAKGQLYTIE